MSGGDDDSFDGLTGDEMGAELMRRQNERHRLKEQILEQQVKEMKELIANMDSSSPATLTRVKHLLLLEECNGLWDIIPISKAINYLHEHPPPTDSEEVLAAYLDTIPLDVGSDEWCFTVLILIKQIPFTSRSNIYDYYDDDDNNQSAKMH